MGWSCAAIAGGVLDAWREACRAQTSSSNTWEERDYTRYFFEVSNVEHRDGAITGSIVKLIGSTLSQKVGSFRIEPNGECKRGPKILRAVARKVGPDLRAKEAFRKGALFYCDNVR